MSITFIYLGISYNRFSGAKYHLGSEYIRAYLASYGISSTRLVSEDLITLDQLAHLALDTGSPVFGFTCYDNSYYLNRLLAEKIKELSPGAIILFGGPSATFSDRLILRDCHAIDICVRGEGEETIKELLNVPTKDKKDIHGISFRQEDNIVRTPDRPLIGSGGKDAPLDFLPSPYLAGMIPGNIRHIPGILSSRGCPYSCIYCNFAAMSGHRFRTHSVERVLHELEAIIKGNSRNKRIDFLDDTFTLYPERAEKICRGIIDRGLNQVPYWCETRADKVDEKLLHLMKKAGFADINFGLESAEPLVLNRCRKLRNCNGEDDNFAIEREFIQKVEQAVSTSIKIGLNPSVSIILGLPGDTRDSAKKTLAFVRHLGVQTYFHNHLTLFPGTELFQKANNYGIRTRKSLYTLPYNTILTYDTYALPLIENSTTVNSAEIIRQERNINYFQKVTGIPGHDDDLSILFYHCPRIQHTDLTWIKTFSSLSLGLGWIAPSGVQSKDFSKIIVQAELPCIHPYLLVPGFSEEEQYVWADYLSKTYYPKSFPVFYMIPLGKIEQVDKLIKRDEKALFIYTLTDTRDHSKFMEMRENLSKEGIEALPKPLLETRFALLDECRWAPFPCPACNLSRIVIHKDRNITPCITGNSIGKVGEDISRIKERLELYKKKEEKERGCATCPAQDTCSHCLFPAPLDSSEFCRLQQNTFNIQQATNIFSSLRAAYQLQSLPRKLFLTFYPTLSPEALQGIDRLAKALQLRKTLKHKLGDL